MVLTNGKDRMTMRKMWEAIYGFGDFPGSGQEVTALREEYSQSVEMQSRKDGDLVEKMLEMGKTYMACSMCSGFLYMRGDTLRLAGEGEDFDIPLYRLANGEISDCSGVRSFTGN